MSGDSGAILDRTRTPEPGEVRPFHFPEVSSSSLDTGLALRTARLSRLPVVSVLLIMDAGESVVEAGNEGLAVLTGDALEGGTEERSGAELAEALEGIGASLSVTTGWDSTRVGLSCLADRMEEALSLLAEMVLRPSFPADEVERLRQQRLAAIQQRKTDPRSLAQDQAAHFFYADGVPYGRPQAGTADSMSDVGPDDAAEFARSHFHPTRGGLVVVGDVKPDGVESLAREHFGGWAGEGPGPRIADVKPRFRERKIVVVDRPGAVQSELRMGHVGVSRDTEDYFSLLVFNTILGGAFTSRLNLNLREEHGFTYGVRSGFSFRRGPGPFSISTAVGTEVTARAVEEAVSELEGLLAEGPTEEEVDSARNYIAGVFPLRFETTSKVASRLGELIVYDLPDDYHATYRDRIRAVSVSDAAEAGRGHIRPDELTIVVVGDADEVADPLRELDLGPVEVHGDA